MKQLKTVLVGCGIIDATHTDVLKQLGKNLVAVCDMDMFKWRKNGYHQN